MIRLYNNNNPHRVVLDYFAQHRAQVLLPRWLVLEDYDVFAPPELSKRFQLTERTILEDENQTYGRGSGKRFARAYRAADPEYVWRPVALQVGSIYENNNNKNRPLFTYHVYVELVNRLDQLERLLSDHGTLPPTITRAVRQLQDQFQLLSLYIETQAAYSDQELYQAGNERAPLAMFRPRAELAFSMERLPELASQVYSRCKFWDERFKPAPQDDPQVTALMRILSKTVPSPCKGRAITDILPEMLETSMKQDSLLIQCMQRFVMASLLGVYTHATVIASFGVRHMLYRYFCLQWGDGMWLCRWVARHKFLAIYVIREFLFDTMEQLPGLTKYMERHYHWARIVANTHEVMDMARRHLNDSVHSFVDQYPLLDDNGVFNSLNQTAERCYFELHAPSDRLQQLVPWHAANDGLFVRIEQQLELYNKNNLMHCYRALSRPFAEVVLIKMQAISNQHFDWNEHQRLQTLRWNNVDDLHNSEVLPMVMDRWFEYLTEISGDQTQLPSYEMLLIITRLSLSTVTGLQHAQELYESETDRSCVDKFLARLWRSQARDFRILQSFFAAIDQRLSILCYPLPSNIAERQLASELRIHNVTSEAELPPDTASYLLCINCGEIKHAVYSPQLNTEYIHDVMSGKTAPLKNIPIQMCKENQWPEVSLDLSTGRLFCARYSFKPDKQEVPGAVESAVDDLMAANNGNDNDAFDDNQQYDDDDDDKGKRKNGGAKSSKKKKTTKLTDHSARKKRSKDVHKKEHFVNCPCAELRRVNMLGTLLCTRDRGCVIRCAGCPTLITLSPLWHRFGNTGDCFSCAKCQTNLKQSITTTTTTTTTTPNIASTTTTNPPNVTYDGMGVPLNQQTTTNNKAPLQSNRSKVRYQRLYNSRVFVDSVCCLCSRETKPSQEARLPMLMDVPENAPLTIAMATFCAKHNKLYQFAKKQSVRRMMRLSTLYFLKRIHDERHKARREQAAFMSNSRVKPLYGVLAAPSFKKKRGHNARLMDQRERQRRVDSKIKSASSQIIETFQQEMQQQQQHGPEDPTK